MNPKHLQLLQHTIGADQYGQRKGDRNYFCTDPEGPDGQIIQELIKEGLMWDHGAQKIAGGMHYYHATSKGIDVVALQSPSPPKLTRSQLRYRRYLDIGDCFPSFLEFLKYDTTERKGMI